MDGVLPFRDTLPATHAEVAYTAGLWLRDVRGCATVLVTLANVDREKPSVLGIGPRGTTTVIEAVCSRGEFVRIAPAILERMGRYPMGERRMFACPEGELGASDLPPGWGLVTCGKTRDAMRLLAEPSVLPSDPRQELLRVLGSLQSARNDRASVVRTGGPVESTVILDDVFCELHGYRVDREQGCPNCGARRRKFGPSKVVAAAVVRSGFGRVGGIIAHGRGYGMMEQWILRNRWVPDNMAAFLHSLMNYMPDEWSLMMASLLDQPKNGEVLTAATDVAVSFAAAVSLDRPEAFEREAARMRGENRRLGGSHRPTLSDAGPEAGAPMPSDGRRPTSDSKEGEAEP